MPPRVTELGPVVRLAGQPPVVLVLPGRAEDLSGLPPPFIIVGEPDLFVDEDVEYAQRLIQAGVPTALHAFPGSFHGSDLMVPTSENIRRWARIRTAALRRALHANS